MADDTIARLFTTSGAARWGLSHAEFRDVVDASISHAFGGREPDRRERERYLAGLHAADLALAGACALGREVAWDEFVLTHRAVLYRAADALNPAGGAREIADSLYADLYGLTAAGDARRSLFRYFHGRSSLATWLRSVLAQRYVDALRAQRRTAPLEDDERAAAEAPQVPADPDRATLVPLVERALRTAIDRLTAKDRLRLRSYYVTQLTLAAIGRITGEHEATVSRQLARTRRDLRAAMERHLKEEAGLSDAQRARALELAIEDPGRLDLQEMMRKEPAPDRSK